MDSDLENTPGLILLKSILLPDDIHPDHSPFFFFLHNPESPAMGSCMCQRDAESRPSVLICVLKCSELTPPLSDPFACFAPFASSGSLVPTFEVFCSEVNERLCFPRALSRPAMRSEFLLVSPFVVP